MFEDQSQLKRSFLNRKSNEASQIDNVLYAKVIDVCVLGLRFYILIIKTLFTNSKE